MRPSIRPHKHESQLLTHQSFILGARRCSVGGWHAVRRPVIIVQILPSVDVVSR